MTIKLSKVKHFRIIITDKFQRKYQPYSLKHDEDVDFKMGSERGKDHGGLHIM